MKKIFYILASAIVALGAVACENEGLENINPEINGDTVSFVAGINRTDLDENNATIWDADETIVVTWNGNNYNFVNSAENNTTFSCTAEGLSAIVDAESIKAVYSNNGNGMIDSAAGTAGALLEYEGAFKGIAFEVKNAFLKFTAAKNAAIKLAGEGLFVVDGVVANEVELTATGAAQYVAVNAPATATLSYSVDGTVCNSKEITTATKKIYNLGTFEKPFVSEKSAFGIVGSFQGWDVAAGKPVAMYTTPEGWVVARGVELYKDDEFKIVKGNSWDVNYGPSAAGVMALDTEKALTKSGQNMKAAKNGKFDIYFNETGAKFKYTCVEEISGTVNITIENKANWSPLYITLKKGTEVIADNATVTNNTFAVSAAYISEDLSYTLTTSDASKKSEGIVNITRNGASIVLEETAVKTTIVLELTQANQKTYWGNTSKIHVWNTGTSFDTSWPGKTMTKTGTYTWSIDVPSNLIGKTINFLIHNGSGWQSPDSKITIKEGENKVTDTSLGIK